MPMLSPTQAASKRPEASTRPQPAACRFRPPRLGCAEAAKARPLRSSDRRLVDNSFA
jgi:hypothetical protein